MKRLFLVLSLTVILGLVLVACGATPTPTPTKAPPTAAPAAPTATATKPPAAPVTLKLWSHWADQDNKKAVVTQAAKNFEAKNPNVKVEITWWQKADMWVAMRNAFTAGEGFPDVFYYDTGVLEFLTAGWIADLTEGVNWNNVEGWAKDFWTMPGPGGKTGIWAVPLEASVDEIYYNKKMFRDLGITVPASHMMTQDEFKEAVRKCTAAGKAAFADGIGDRDYPGQYIYTYLMLDKLGQADLKKLWMNEISYNDPRVVEVIKYWKELIDMKAYPTVFTSLKLGDSHIYFHTEQKACMFPVASWYTGRAFQAPEKGGQPADFELGMMYYPAMKDGKGHYEMFLAVGGAISVAAKSKNLALAKGLANEFATEEIGNMWMARVADQTGVKTNPAKIDSPYKAYFAERAATHKDAKMVVLSARTIMKPGMWSTQVAVVNEGLPAGLISADEAIKKLEEARVAGK